MKPWPLSDYMIVITKKGGDYNTGGYILTAKVNGKRVYVGTPATSTRYCEQDKNFLETWAKRHPLKYILELEEKSKDAFYICQEGYEILKEYYKKELALVKKLEKI